MSIPRTVAKSFRHVLGTPKPLKLNPWPKCPSCFHRFPGLCIACRRCDGCCEKCVKCGLCVWTCEGHVDKDPDESTDEGRFRFSVQDT